MIEFKVGDKVRVTRRGTHQFPVGHIGTITYAKYNKPAQPLRVGEGEANWVYPDEVELVTKEKKKKKIKYPVGTIVQLVPEELPKVHDGGWTKEPLKVVQYDKGSDAPYVVAWTTPDSHSGIRVGMVLSRKFSVKQLRKYEEPKGTPELQKVKDEIQDVLNAHIQMRQDMMRLHFKHTVQPVLLEKAIKEKKEKSIMTTIREKIRYAALSKDEKLLRENDILSDNGNLTDVGRRVVLDILFEDKELRKRVVTAVESTIDKK